MSSMRIVTVFGNGRIDENYPAYQKAVLIGRMLAQAGFTICNGGYGGIMEATARGAKEANGRTIGITTKQFSNTANRWIDEERKVSSWKDRLFELIETGDAYLVLDGATGTLTELFVVWEMTNKNFLNKPIILFGPFLQSLLRCLKKESQILFNPRIELARKPEEIVYFLKRES